MTTLAVWLNSEHIADLEQVRSGDLHLRYLPASISARGLGSIALSIALPARPRHKGQVVTRWVESMLPEGETRTSLEDRFGVHRGDSFGLLQAIGADCAGAVSFLAPTEAPINRLVAAQPLTAADIAMAVKDLPRHPLGANEHVRVSLGGMQAKLLRRHGRRWITDFAALAQDMILRIAVGDTDGHARNYGFLHVGDAVEMAPIYDVAPTSLHVAGRQVGLWIAGQSYLAHVTAEHLAAEVQSWGVPSSAARELVETSLEKLAAAVPDAVERVPQVSEETVSAIAGRIHRLLRPA